MTAMSSRLEVHMQTVRSELERRLLAGEPAGKWASLLARLEGEVARRDRFDRELESVAGSGAGEPAEAASAFRSRALPGVDLRAQLPTRTLREPTDDERQRGVAVAYRTKRFSLYRAVVERLQPGEKVRMEFEPDVSEMTRREIEHAFPNIVASASYRTGTRGAPGRCMYVQAVPPPAATPFKVA